MSSSGVVRPTNTITTSTTTSRGKEGTRFGLVPSPDVSQYLLDNWVRTFKRRFPSFVLRHGGGHGGGLDADAAIFSMYVTENKNEVAVTGKTSRAVIIELSTLVPLEASMRPLAYKYVYVPIDDVKVPVFTFYVEEGDRVVPKIADDYNEIQIHAFSKWLFFNKLSSELPVAPNKLLVDDDDDDSSESSPEAAQRPFWETESSTPLLGVDDAQFIDLTNEELERQFAKAAEKKRKEEAVLASY